MSKVSEFITKYSDLINKNQFKEVYKQAITELHNNHITVLTRLLHEGLGIDSYDFAKQVALEEFYNALMNKLVKEGTIHCIALLDFVTSHWCPTVGLDWDDYARTIVTYLEELKDEIYVEAVVDGFGNVFIQSVGE